MDKTHFTLGEIADLLAVPRHNPKNWIRLHAEHPCFLPSTVILQDGRGIRVVAVDDFVEWLQRNPEHRDRVLALFAPPDVQAALPLACHVDQHVPRLRPTPSNDQPPAPVSGWWAPINELDQQPQENPQ